MSGPAGQQIVAVGLILFGLLTIFTVAGLNSGALINGWARLLVYLFGWGAYPVAGLITVLGLLWLRHLVHRPTAWRWRPFLGWEMTLLGLLALTHTIVRPGWEMVGSGRGGGLIGWGMSVFFIHQLGSLNTGMLMGIVILVGLGLAFDLTTSDVQAFGRRFADGWRAWQQEREQARRAKAQKRRAPASTARLAEGVTASPIERSTEGGRPSSPEPPPAAPPARKPSGPPSGPPSAPARSEPAAKTAAEARREIGLPPVNLLEKSRASGMDQEEIRRKSRIIEETLAQFGVPAEVTEVRPGPTVTQFGVTPGYIRRGDGEEKPRKVRVSQITSLSSDLALALAARSLRTEAPVPGRAVVGIEVPNADIARVTLRRVLESEAFERCRTPLCFAVGLDVAGSAIVADLATMPHLLVAGTTGSGKSVFVKSLAASFIMRNPPDELKLIAVDPKMVELSHLNGLPHLLAPAQTDLEDILRVLRWVAVEMDNRYKKFAEVSARNLGHYNQKAKKKGEEALYRIVVLIDELADLMMAAPEDTERTLTRIAQMARATGIHLVVATQRPSTDVVTGLIKANFPARVSFATASNTDSRVILDMPGAESLLGRGDMLFLPPDASAPRRVQGCYISDEEIEKLIRFWQKQVGATPAQGPWEAVAEEAGPEMLRIEGEGEDADLLEKAIDLARHQGKISTSGIQRRLHISYPRAARLMEQMEAMGIVGPQQAAGRKRRVILGGEEE